MAERIRGLSIGLDLDSTGIDRSLGAIKRSFRDLNSSLKTNLNNFKFTEKSVDSYKNAIRDLDKTMQGQRKNVDGLKKKLDELTNAGKSHTREASQIRQEYNRQADALNALERQYENTKNEFVAFNKEQSLANTRLGSLSKKFDEMGPRLTGIGDQMKNIGQSMSMYVTAPIAAGFGLSVKTAADFEAQMARVGAISQSSKSDLKAMSDQAVELGANTSKSAQEVAIGMEELAAMGFNSKEIMGAMPGVIAAAEASGADMAQTSKVMASAMNAFGLEASESTHIADILAQTANQSAADITDMEYALKYAAAPAKALGMSLEETSAGIGMMVDAGLKGEQAGTTLRGALLGLLDPSEENSKLMDKMGIEITDAEGNFVGLAQLVENLSASMEGMTDTQKAANISQLVGKEAVSGMLVLMEQGPDKIRKMTKGLEESDGASKKAADQMKNNLKGSLEQLGGAIESLGIQIGSILSPAMRWLADMMAGVVDKLGAMPHWLQVVTVAFGVLAAAIGPIAFGMGAFISVIGSAMTTLGPMIGAVNAAGGMFGFLSTKLAPILTKLPILKAAFAVLTGPIGIAVAAIAALGVAFVIAYKKSETFRNIVNGVVNTVKQTFQKFLNFIKPFTDGIVNTFKSIVGAISGFATQIGNQISEFWNKNGAEIKQALTNIFNVFKTIFMAIYTVISTVFNTLILPVIKVGMKVIQTVMSVVWKLVKALVVSTWNNIKGVIQGALKIIMGVIKVFSSLFTGNWKGMWEGIKQVVKGAVQLVWNLINLWFVGKILKTVKAFGGLFKGLFNGIWNAVKKIFSTALSLVFNTSKRAFTNIFNIGKSIFNALKNFFSAIWNGIKNVFSASLGRIWSGVKNSFSRIFNFGRDTFTKLKNTMSNLWNTIKENTVGKAEAMKKKVTGIFSGMKDGIKKHIDKIKDHIGGMTKGVKKGLNKLIGGVNWVGAKLGMDKIPSMKLSTGTGSLTRNGKLTRDTFATVGDKGRGNGPNGFRHEMIRYPNGKTVLTPNRDTKAFLPKGSQVINGQDTYNYLNSPRFANGTDKKPFYNQLGDAVGKTWNSGVDATKDFAGKTIKGAKAIGKQALDAIGDVYDFATNPGKLVDKVLKAFGVDFSFVKGDILGGLMKGMYKKLKGSVKALFTTWLDDGGGGGDGSSFTKFTKTTPYSPNGAVPGYPSSFNGGKHFGIDYATPVGTVLKAPTAGTVARQHNHGGGLVAKLLSGKFTQFFLHLSEVLKTGPVKKGEAFAKTGNSGAWTTGPHLHYQVEKGASPSITNANTIDPEKFLSGVGGKDTVGKKWSSEIRRAARQMKVSITEADVSAINAQIMRESSGNQNIVQSSAVWDVNTASGNPAQGLLQYIPQTFRAYAVKGHTNIRSGYDQLLAFFNNSNWRRDNPGGRSGWGPTGSRRFATGGLIKRSGWYNIAEGGYPEWVIPTDPARRSEAMQMIAMAANQIQGNATIGNKRPNQLNMPNSSNDELLNAVLQQNGILMEMLQKLTGIEAKPILSTDDIGRANDKYNAKNASMNNIKRGRLNYV
ncbi:phage tail tape measure protein [Macrococcoides canis]|uniref:phage tail tape measure protein n=1 Tax=Macrococcoides canis TaxID=1855823 RepID=UPI00105F80C1|nr:phage tail tape measure protein [Macrococcus canis]TDM35189.1 phage tail tape measure protein [Macrococcus canis]